MLCPTKSCQKYLFKQNNNKIVYYITKWHPSLDSFRSWVSFAWGSSYSRKANSASRGSTKKNILFINIMVLREFSHTPNFIPFRVQKERTPERKDWLDPSIINFSSFNGGAFVPLEKKVIISGNSFWSYLGDIIIIRFFDLLLTWWYLLQGYLQTCKKWGGDVLRTAIAWQNTVLNT